MKPLKSVFGLMCLGLFLVPSQTLKANPPVPPAQAGPDSTTIQYLGQFDTGQDITSITLQDHYAYLGTGQGMLILDLARPDAPRKRGFFRTPMLVQAIALSGNVAYLANSEQGLRILDVSDPDSPMEVGLVPPPPGQYGSIEDVAVSGAYAYAAAGFAGGLRVLDIQQPAVPKEIGVLYQDVSGLFPQGKTLYSNAIQIIDVSDPAYPTLAGAYDPFAYGHYYHHYRFKVQGRYAYATWGYRATQFAWGGVEIIDVANPAQPALVGEHNGGYGVDLAIADHYLYNTVFDIGHDPYPYVYNVLEIIDVADPAQPRVITSRMDNGLWASAMAVSKSYIYLADRNGYLQIYWFAPASQASIPPSGGNLASTLDGATYKFPPGAFLNTVTATHTPLRLCDGPAGQNLAGISHCFSINAKNDSGDPVLPELHYTLTIEYTDEEIRGVREESLGLYFWDGIGKHDWIIEPSAVLDPATNTIRVQTRRFGYWSVLGKSTQIFLPVLRN